MKDKWKCRIGDIFIERTISRSSALNVAWEIGKIQKRGFRGRIYLVSVDVLSFTIAFVSMEEIKSLFIFWWEWFGRGGRFRREKI